MKRDYSNLFGDTATVNTPASKRDQLGWKPVFAQQCPPEDAHLPPVRVMAVHRSGLHVMGDEGLDLMLPPMADVTVGDWLLYDQTLPAHSRRLDRKSLFKRKAPGTGRDVQLIAANVDTAFIVTSCNQDFNIARLERYIALAFEAKVDPVILLTKADLCDAPYDYADQAKQISNRVPVLFLDARGAEPKTKLAPWCKRGQTIAFLGSSGVGKSTLVNALAETTATDTAGIREDDSKGRHTTTSRQLHLMSEGYCVMDTPGMRELQLTDARSGLADVFSDLHDLATQCNFSDCQHDTEPGCAIQSALGNGTIDMARLQRWRKLIAEERFNSASLSERKADAKALSKTIRSVIKHEKH